MFGYIRAIKPEMKCLEYDLYRGVYCGLCRQLGADYGQFSRFSLTYDCTLLAMLGLCIALSHYLGRAISSSWGSSRPVDR